MQWTYFEAFRDILAFGKALYTIGVGEKKAVNIMGANSPEWVTAHFGAICYNAVATGVYITNNADACHYQAEHSGAEVICVDSVNNLKKYLSNKDKLPNVKAYVLWLEKTIPEDCKLPNVYLWKDFLTLGKSVPDSEIQARMDKQRPGECACLVYTSGTTGRPKGVMCSHDNLTFSARLTIDEQLKDNSLTTEDRILSYLPLSHIAGNLLDLMGPLVIGC